MSGSTLDVMERVAVIDVGSNSVRLVVYDGAARSPAYFYNEKVLCGLGRGVRNSLHLHPEGKERAITALTRFRALIDHFQISNVTAVATAAVRMAKDGPAFCKQIREELGLALTVISGEQEAHFSAKGILLGAPNASGIVCDIGGSSMEFAKIEDGRVVDAVSTELGPLSLQDLSPEQSLDTEIASQLDTALQTMSKAPERLYLVGGSWRAVARLDMARRDYPLHVLQDYQTTAAELQESLAQMQTLSEDEIAGRISVSQKRLSLLPTAAKVLSKVLDKLEPARIVFSSYGLREGILYDRMPRALRLKSPLLEACLAQETRNARFPGFGEALFHWVRPILGAASPLREQSVRAACYLHDVYWRSHPDYRSEICFDGATHANFGGISHRGRMFVAWALMHRYGAKTSGKNVQGIEQLLTPQDQTQAEILGKAMRLGSMLTGSDPNHLGALSIKQDRLVLTLPQDGSVEMGEVATKRFVSLANKMNLVPTINGTCLNTIS